MDGKPMAVDTKIYCGYYSDIMPTSKSRQFARIKEWLVELNFKQFVGN